MQNYKDLLQTFTLDTLPDLDAVTLGALELFSETVLPEVDYRQFKRPLVVGSGNAAVTGRVLFNDADAIFADESSYIQKLEAHAAIDGAFVISASGSKHAVQIVEELIRRSIPIVLLTNNEFAPARELLPDANVHVFPKNREPYTYNTSTYMGMILSKTKEDPAFLSSFIAREVEPKIPNDLNAYGAYYLIVPEHLAEMRGMLQTKFDELFGPRIMARIFTREQTKHAKTVIAHESELFVSFGEENTLFGKPENRITIPLPADAGYAALMAVGYYFVGQIQKQLFPYYKNRIEAYVKETSEMFGSTISPIVE